MCTVIVRGAEMSLSDTRETDNSFMYLWDDRFSEKRLQFVGIVLVSFPDPIFDEGEGFGDG